MKSLYPLFFSLFFVLGCSQKGIDAPDKREQALFANMPQTSLSKSDFNALPDWEEEEFEQALASFRFSCQSTKTRTLYRELCEEAFLAEDAESFLRQKFRPYKIENHPSQKEGLLTGYYEPLLHGSKTQSDRYRYPLYATPKDLITVDLGAIYPELKHYRLRGRIEGDKLVPYYTRAQSEQLDAEVLCYVDSKIERFFLEIQGSGRVLLDTNETLYVGYANQNGHKYSAIGGYLVAIGALEREEVSLQSIKQWLEANPDRVDEVLNSNDSVVYFALREKPASGSLGIELTPKRSVAIDKRYIPLGSMLYLSAPIKEEHFSRIVLAQDTGGAIKGAVRADLFLGYGEEAMETAGELKAPLQLWILLPKQEESEQG